MGRNISKYSKFRKIEELSCQSPTTISDLWVLWRPEATTTNSFWAPTMAPAGGRCFLTTSHQPFAFKYIRADLIAYRKNCVGYTFVVGDGDGVIGRVFRNQLPEFCSDLRNYSLQQHPQRDHALRCGLTRTWAFPVFGPSQQSCVGVLEFLFSTSSILSCNFGGIFTALETVECIGGEADEIRGALRQVCEAHHLSLACGWFRCRRSTSWRSHNYLNVSGRGDFVVLIPELFTCDFDTSPESDISPANWMAFQSLLMRVGQGLIGNTFSSDKPYLCRDVTQLSMSQYPMVHTARDLGFTGSITICLQSIATELHPTIVTEMELGALQNEGEVLKADFPGHNLATEESVKSGGDSFVLEQSREAIIPEKNCLEKRLTTVPEEKHREKKSNAHNHKDSSCSYEILKQHFGRKLEDAAKSLGVSRSTVKRWCRENKVTALPPIPKQIKEPVQGNVEPISDARGKVPSSADVPTDLAPKRAMNTMTVKATYRNDIIKFLLPFSSRMIELVEKVTLIG